MLYQTMAESDVKVKRAFVVIIMECSVVGFVQMIVEVEGYSEGGIHIYTPQTVVEERLAEVVAKIEDRTDLPIDLWVLTGRDECLTEFPARLPGLILVAADTGDVEYAIAMA